MNPCVLILFTISTILVMATKLEVNQQKRLQPEPFSSNKKSKTHAITKNAINDEKKYYVAVIGGGINAALFTHYLHELMEVEVHIYNHGMIQKPENSLFLVHESQKYMMEMISKFKLDTKDLNRPIVMYDGQKNSILNFQQNDPIKPFIEHYIKHSIQKFEKIYDIQQKELRSFKNLSRLLKSMCATFPKMLKISTREFIMKKWKNRSDIMKIVHSLLLLNYGQNLESNAFAGLTSLIFSQSTGKLKRIITPIGELIKKLVDESDKLFDLDVLKVTHETVSKGVFRPQINWISHDGKKLSQVYDYVVIATPEIGNILSEINKRIVVCKNRDMIFTTVTSSLKEEVFENSNLITAIANVKDSGSIRFANKISNSEWKIIADDYGSVSTEISTIFNITGSAKVKKRALWPDYSDKECAINAKFVLDARLFYLNAIEWASSLLEMKAIGARNTALRIKNLKDQLIIWNESAHKGW